jgi:hypothetical protein
MFKSCIVCSAVASPDVLIQYCDACQSAMYCSRACQRIDWKKQHKKICKLLNVGHGDMQVRCQVHSSRSTDLKENFEREQRSLTEDMKRFFKLFEQSTFDGSRAAARKMKKIAKRQTKRHQIFTLIHGLRFLLRSDSEMLSWPNSPLLVMLQFVDPNVMFGNEEATFTPLHQLAIMADTLDYSTHESQLVLAKQLIEHGANVNAVSTPYGRTPLQTACSWDNVTNLDFIEYMLTEGADPNAQDHEGLTPLMYTTALAPGAAKFLLNWPTTDANVTDRYGRSFLAHARRTLKSLSDKISLSDSPEQVQNQFLLQQWIGIEKMLVERSAIDTDIPTLD